MTKGTLVTGVVSQNKCFEVSQVMMQITVDKNGKTLSLTADQGIMISVDYDDVVKLLKEAKNEIVK